MKRILLLLGVVAIVGVFAAVAFAFEGGPGSDQEPMYVAGNPKCSDIEGAGSAHTVKVDPGANGTFGFVQITNYDGKTFDWNIVSSYLNVVDADVVIVKGGPNALVYFYGLVDNGTDDDFGTGLHAPVNPNNGKYYGISHIQFCFDPKT